VKDNKSTSIVSTTQKERYRIFIEDVADGFFETDLKGHFLFFNDALCRIFGFTRNEIQNASFRRFLDPAEAEQAFQNFNYLFKTGETEKGLEWKIRHKDGELRWVKIHANLIFNADGRKTGFRGIARDMTDRILAEKALKESEQCTLKLYEASHRAEQRYRTLLDFIPNPIFVLNRHNRVTYLNPAFEAVFGWTLKELKGHRRIPFIPEKKKEETRQGTKRLFKEKVIRRFETQRLTKDGRLLDIQLNAALFYESEEEPAGQIVILRDFTRHKRLDRINQALFRISKSLHRFRTLDDRLVYITKQIRELLAVEGASVILLDEEKNEFFFPVSAFGDEKTTRMYREVRFPADKGVAGKVRQTGKPVIVPDTNKSEFFFSQVDERTGFHTRNMLDVPLESHDRIIGVLCAVNKKNGAFDQTDVELLGTIAGMVALPLENARINEALNRSYEDVKILNKAKDRVIHHLSHELKTPISVLSASLGLIAKKTGTLHDPGMDRILDRSRRNLERLLDMQYEIEDILRGGNFRTHQMLTTLLDTCSDELEMLVSENLGEEDIISRIRQLIDDEFGPKDPVLEQIQLDQFVKDRLRRLKPLFAHRNCRLETRIQRTGAVLIPSEVLGKIIDGLVRNAVENTPDGSLIRITVHADGRNPVLTVNDFGVGITGENQAIIFESCFSTTDIMQYASRQRFDFNAGGRGFDLLRMKIFSERYNFDIQLNSIRCRFIPRETDQCPGNIDQCRHCQTTDDCLTSGGTTVTVRFQPAEKDKESIQENSLND
jgi:PAS domain S-box-containing protein